MDQWKGSVAVVTGASAGIGRSIATKLALCGMRVCALARREDRLKELTDSLQGIGEIRGYKCDISQDDEVVQVFARIEQDMGPIRVLVNNAGIAPEADLIDIDIDLWKGMFNANVFGMFSCVRELIKSVKQRHSDHLVHIINVNSLAGHYTLPDVKMTVYCSSKHCVTLLTRGLIKQISQERLNIRVTSLSPGVVETEIRKAVGRESDYSVIPHLSGEDLADAAVAILSAPPNVIISELSIKPKGEVL